MTTRLLRKRRALTAVALLCAAAFTTVAAAPPVSPPAEKPTGQTSPLAAEGWFQQWRTTTADPTADVRNTHPKLALRTDKNVLWRGANREPAVIWEKGLRPKAEGVPEKDRQYNWVSQVKESSKGSVFSGTSRSWEVARSFGEWVYEIHAPWGIDQEKSGTYDTRGGSYRYEEEITFPGGIKPKFIKEACPRQGKCVANPYFDPGAAGSVRTEPKDVAAISIDWERVWPTQSTDDLRWFPGGKTTWAVGTTVLNPAQGKQSFREGLKPRAAQHPWLAMFETFDGLPEWEKKAVGAAVPAFLDKQTAEKLLRTAENGGWIYEISPAAGGFRTDALNDPTTAPPSGPREIGYVGGVRGSLLLSACHYPKGSTFPDECIRNHAAAAAP